MPQRHGLNIPAIGQEKRALLWLCSTPFADVRQLLQRADKTERNLSKLFVYAGKSAMLHAKEQAAFRLLRTGLFNVALSNLFVASLFQRAEIQSDYALTCGLSMRQISDRILPVQPQDDAKNIEANEIRVLGLIRQALPAAERENYPNLRDLLTCRRATAEHRLGHLSV